MHTTQHTLFSTAVCGCGYEIRIHLEIERLIQVISLEFEKCENISSYHHIHHIHVHVNKCDTQIYMRWKMKNVSKTERESPIKACVKPCESHRKNMNGNFIWKVIIVEPFVLSILPILQAVLNYIIDISWFDQIQINANISTVTTSTTCALIIYLAHSIKGNCCGFEPVCPLCTPNAVHTLTTATCRSSYWRTHKNVNDIQTVILDDGVWSSCSTVLLDFVGASWCGIHCHEMKFEIEISGGIGHSYNFELI